MSAYNTVKSEQVCRSCGNIVTLAIQFKYGEVRQYEYQIGDQLTWGGNDIDIPGQRRVVLDAAAEACGICGAEGLDYEVYLENDRIISVKPFSGKYDFVGRQESYIVLEK